MKCPFCGHIEDKVVDSRLSADGEAIRRRRECEKCARRFTSYERVEEIMPMVVKKDGRREPFDRQKVLSGLKKACEKRPISIATLESVADDIEKKLLEGAEKEISSSAVGEEIMKRLQELDKVAYVRFASVYREFKDINEFVRELTDLLGSEKKKK
ncbi:MAG TPA: transcriptional regulator NrdR [Nitrospirota bacterium]|nr:transcriptional regulator NrdR [Nitrospirota bacterium]